jgi:hypothetical protein
VPASAAAKPSATPEPAAPSPEQPARGKRNERPGVPPDTASPRSDSANAATADAPVYFYEFAQPNFLVRKVAIEHDENGKGRISFLKGSFPDLITDPIEISPAAMDRLRAAFGALNFLDSTDNYQYEKDYSHLGVVKITMRKSGRERTSEFNWTENKEAKALSDEYRRLSNQYIWMFDITLARENQPLQAPALLDELDSLVRRNEVSDGEQMTVFLKKLSQDERIPLIARNHATKIITAIEKQAAKDKK